MLKVATAKEMQEIDRITIEKYGVAGAVLMERAGLAVARRVNDLFLSGPGDRTPEKRGNGGIKVIVLCGGGNNGGDGFVAARILHNEGKDVKVFLAADPHALKGDAMTNYRAAVNYGVKIYPIKKFPAFRPSLSTSDTVVVDALLGTGLSRGVRPPVSGVINLTNTLTCPVLSVDIPSGISSDTGQVMGCAIRARYTVTFGLPKRGHLLFPGADYTGKLFVEEIGFPEALLGSDAIRVDLTGMPDAQRCMPERPRHSHKGTYGHVLLIAGSRGKTGAAFMAAKACLRAGAGLVTIGIPGSLLDIFQKRATEEMILPLPDKGNGTLSMRAADEILGFIKKRATVAAVGPGMSVDDEISELVRLLITGSKVPLVVDADGINAIAGRAGVIRKSRVPVILTPHAGEMARLLRRNTSSRKLPARWVGRGLGGDVEQDRITTAVSFARKTKAYLVLKGVPTVIATPGGDAFINSSGNPGMASAGTGDVLTGMIAAFLAQGLSPQSASILGVYMHGLAGDSVAERLGEHSLIASDIINAIPSVFRAIKRFGDEIHPSTGSG